MRSFIKIVFGSCLGVILAGLALGLIFSIYTASLFSAGQGQVKVEKNSVLKLSFDQVIPEKTNNTEAAIFNFSNDAFVGTYDIIESIRSAKEDKNIKGIYLHMSFSNLRTAKAEYIREALIDFKESGKFIYAYCGDYGYGQIAYYLATVADEVVLHPMGIVDFRGFSTAIPFFKDMLDNVGISMRAFYAGKYKGATEPYRLNQMSEENRYQIKSYLNELYDNFLDDISASRNLSKTELKRIASQLQGRRAELALESGLVDAIKFEDEVLDDLRKQLDLGEEDDLSLIELSDYHQVREKDRNIGAPSKIAILYAEGEIRNGDETYGMVTDDHYVKMIREIGKDDKVRALVLRVNSPGGDAFVSDEIWRALEQLQEKDIKVVASMGDVAASGGYYIACGADEILAEPNTITGSIGVFGMVPNAEKLLNDKIGIHLDTVKTERYSAGVVNPFYPIGEEEAALVQEGVDNAYNIFLSRVAEGRGMDRDAVHEIAQGRVWTGRKGVEIGLVDDLGDLHDAIARAASLAGIDDYRITEYPRIKDPIQKLMEELTGEKLVQSAKDHILKSHHPQASEWLHSLIYVLESGRPMARLPYLITTN